MNPETLTRFKALFEQERGKLIYSKHILNEEFHLSKDDTLDEVDMTSAELEQSMRMRLRSREALYLRKIGEALKRIQEGSFGDCEDCGETIGLKRLEARPTTTHCVTCKEAEERTERGFADGHRPKSVGETFRILA